MCALPGFELNFEKIDLVIQLSCEILKNKK